MQHLQYYLLLFMKGLSMGTAEVIPSISSGTVAMVMGIYPTLLTAISNCDKKAFQLLFAKQWYLFWQHIHGDFLLAIGLGIIVSLLSTVRLVRYLLVAHPIQVWSFFFGVSLLAIIITYQQIKRITFLLPGLSLLGICIAYGTLQLTPTTTTEQYWFIFVIGAVAACAMILPGVSGSFFLVIVGKYEFMLDALLQFNLPLLTVFLLGSITGLFLFTKLLIRLLAVYKDQTIALLAGFMIGTLPRAWPWKDLVMLHTGKSCCISNNISPFYFQQLYQEDPLIGQAFLYMCLGGVMIILLKCFSIKHT